MVSTVSVTAASAEERSIDSYTCKDVMREGDTSRQAAIAFLHGFLLAKAGASSVNLEEMAKQTDTFTSRCLDNPTEKALDAMAASKK